MGGNRRTEDEKNAAGSGFTEFANMKFRKEKPTQKEGTFIITEPNTYFCKDQQWLLVRGSGEAVSSMYVDICSIPGKEKQALKDFKSCGRVLSVELFGMCRIKCTTIAHGKQSAFSVDVGYFKLSLSSPENLQEYISYNMKTLKKDLFSIIKQVLLTKGSSLLIVDPKDIAASPPPPSPPFEHSSPEKSPPPSEDDASQSEEEEVVVVEAQKPKRKRPQKETKKPEKKQTKVYVPDAPGTQIAGKDKDMASKKLEDIENRCRVSGVMHLLVDCVKLCPKDENGERPLQVRKIYVGHLGTLKERIRNRPNAATAPHICIVDPKQCTTMKQFVKEEDESYRYFVLGGTHSFKARRQLYKETKAHAFSQIFAFVYVGVTDSEAKLLAMNNMDNEYRMSMSFTDKIKSMHKEYELFRAEHQGKDIKNDHDLYLQLKEQCATECCLTYSAADARTSLIKYDNYFQLAFRHGRIWDLQKRIFDMFVEGTLKTKGKGKEVKRKKTDLTKQKDMGITYWKQMQGLKNNEKICDILQKVVDGEFSLEEMQGEFKHQKDCAVCQQQLMLHLNCDDWERVREWYPTFSSDEKINEYASNFTNWKKKDPVPPGFLNLVRLCKIERSKLKSKQEAASSILPSEFESFNLYGQNCLYQVFQGNCVYIDRALNSRDFTLCIADIPYGFKLPDNRGDESAFTYAEFDAFLSKFKKLNTARLWRMVVFHSSNQAGLVQAAMKEHCNAGYEPAIWLKTNVRGHGGGARLVNVWEMLHIGYYNLDSKRSILHYNTAGMDLRNVFQCPAVLQKLTDHVHQGRVVSPYQKPQRLINTLIEMFSQPGDWIVDAFSGSGTTTACALRKGRNCIAIDIDKDSVAFIRSRISSLESMPDENQELGAKDVDGSAKPTSSEVQPPLTGNTDDPAGFIDLIPLEYMKKLEEPAEQEPIVTARDAHLEIEKDDEEIILPKDVPLDI